MTVAQSSGRPGLSTEQRECFAALADEMIPAARAMPSATGADAHRSGLDAVLRSRPDLADPLRDALDALAAAPAGADAGGGIAWMSSAGHEDARAVLSTVVAAAYFLNAQVRAALGYPGQEAIPVDELADDIDLEQLAQVRARGPVYRPTPPA